MKDDSHRFPYTRVAALREAGVPLRPGESLIG